MMMHDTRYASSSEEGNILLENLEQRMTRK